MSLLRRLWQSVRAPSYFVGKDFEGNRFFEHPSSSDDPRRTKRTVKYRRPDDMWHYIGGGKRLPVQWNAWLTHTRPDPPTLEELHADMARQQRVLMNAALIEARDREERERSLRISAAPLEDDRRAPAAQRSTSEPTLSSPPVAEAIVEPGRPTTANESRPKSSSSDLPKMATEPSYEPESWTPLARRRGSST